MSIVLDSLTKRFRGLPVVERVSLEVADGELFVLLGASGSGKSTILRLIAGLTGPDSGRILLHGRDVTFLPPQQRGTGFVFQNYSIFRHMSVADNIEFGLKIRRVPPAERARRREELLDLVGLAGLGSRYADQLSGGQRQRVALARALAYEPSVLLLDEPFGALDVKIRALLRRSLKEIQDRLGVTTILVTHDQEEAFELGDRIGVIERGRLLEVGPPETLYHRPQTVFVATFLGAGCVLTGRARDGDALFGSLRVPLPPDAPHDDEARVQMLFRPEQVALSAAPPSDGLALGQGTVIEHSFNGPFRRVRLRLPRLPATRQIAPPVPFGEEGLLVDALLPTAAPVAAEQFWVSLRGWHILQAPSPRLLVLDPTQGETPHLALARRLAERLQGTVSVLVVAPQAEAADTLRAEAQRRVVEAGLTGEMKVRFGDVIPQLLTEQAEGVYDYAVLPAGSDDKGRRGLTAEELSDYFQQAFVPSFVVRHAVDIERLVICTAAGEPGKSDVRVGGRLARRLGAPASLLYLTREGSEASPLARHHLERAAGTLRGLDVTTDIRLRSAPHPARGILDEAKTGGYSLIVVGSPGPRRGRSGLGDVTRQVIAGADIPVLVVPAEEF